MKTALKIGVTGGIGSGKSMICGIFKMLGAPIYNADTAAKWLMTHDESVKGEIRNLFGKEAYTPEGQLNSKFIASMVFGNDALLKQLNSIVHPAVGKHFANWVVENAGHPYIVKEAALLFESGAYKEMDLVIVVSAPQEVRLARVVKRDTHRSAEQIISIMQNQLSEEKRNSMADEVIYNDDKVMVIPQVIKLHKRFSSVLEN